MVRKITQEITRSYKPEVMTCPFCGKKLSYRHTVSNKVIQFSNGKYIRVKNLGYGCDHCEHNDIIYFSQTASKLCIKGYTYSSKIIAMIYHYKTAHYSRDQICDLLWEMGIEISDRNVDLIYAKYKPNFDMDYEANIIRHYQEMMDKFHEIRISIDHLTIGGMNYISVRDFFTGEQIGLHRFSDFGENLKNTLMLYLDHKYKITYIVTIRPMFDFYKIIRSICNPSTRILSYLKY